MLKLGWSSAICHNTRGLFYFILNISMSPVLLERAVSKHLQAPWNKPERSSSCISHRWNDPGKGSVFLLQLAVCWAEASQWRWARNTCTERKTPPSSRKVSSKLFPLPQAQRAEKHGHFCTNHVFSIPLVIARQWTSTLTVSVLWYLRKH